MIATIFATTFLPGLLLGLASCWHKGIFKTIVAHPSVVLMPAFTHFTFESSTEWCRGKDEEGEKEEGETRRESTEPFIRFSPKFTLVNIILSIVGNVVYGISMTYMGGFHNPWKGQSEFDVDGVPVYLEYYLEFISIPFAGLLLTVSSLLFISNSSNCNHS